MISHPHNFDLKCKPNVKNRSLPLAVRITHNPLTLSEHKFSENFVYSLESPKKILRVLRKSQVLNNENRLDPKTNETICELLNPGRPNCWRKLEMWMTYIVGEWCGRLLWLGRHQTPPASNFDVSPGFQFLRILQLQSYSFDRLSVAYTWQPPLSKPRAEKKVPPCLPPQLTYHARCHA